ncbi:RHS repeat domain-containing protein, partial [Streptomyces sp. NPDC006285]|uniref:RHS repeat domain-containing protein n=1 Tax=Streptomyces sp. NPDC006285 TaxID=3364742 RepID=UPI0036935304
LRPGSLPTESDKTSHSVLGRRTTHLKTSQRPCGGTDDTGTTGLTHLGAREYDSTTGRFISVDPLMDLTDPQQHNGYSYAENSPITNSDPSGLMACATPIECGGGTQYGNNTPTKNSGGKPLNDPSWGCNGCDGDSYDDGWWSTSGWSDAPSGPTLIPGTITIFPGYNVPEDYGYADELKQQLTKILVGAKSDLGSLSDGITNPESPEQFRLSMQSVAIAKFHACAIIGESGWFQVPGRSGLSVMPQM